MIWKRDNIRRNCVMQCPLRGQLLRTLCKTNIIWRLNQTYARLMHYKVAYKKRVLHPFETPFPTQLSQSLHFTIHLMKTWSHITMTIQPLMNMFRYQSPPFPMPLSPGKPPPALAWFSSIIVICCDAWAWYQWCLLLLLLLMCWLGVDLVNNMMHSQGSTNFEWQ